MKIELAEPGSAVFESVEEETLEGTVVERIPAQAMKSNKQGPSSLLLTGLIEAHVNGRLQKFPFMPKDRADQKQYVSPHSPSPSLSLIFDE